MDPQLKRILEETRKNNPRYKKADPQDIRFATMLLTGADPDDKRQTRLKYPSRNTRPTEKEARAALARVLMSTNPPRIILWYVAALFDREAADMEAYVYRRVDFKKLNQGHRDAAREYVIAGQVEKLRETHSYQEATEKAAAEFGLTPRHVRRTYAKVFPKQRRKEHRSSWKRAGDMSSRTDVTDAR
jgi:hypothetical protein